MLNKIWAALIIISIVFALGNDIADEINNRHHNGEPIDLHYSSISNDRIEFSLPVNSKPLQGTLQNKQLIIHVGAEADPELTLIAHHQPSRDDEQIRARILSHDPEQQQLSILFPELHWIKLQAIAAAAFDMAEFAVKLAIGLAGIMALWLGLMQIAERSGLINLFVVLVRPLLRWLFPQLPEHHPALGSISLNLAANVLGLGNAATPLGIKAMQQLQELNDKKDRASDAMCMFLALNTSSVQLLPPVTLIALMGTGVSELLLPIIIATSCSTLAAIVAVKFYQARSSV